MKLFLKGLLALVALTILAVAVALLPAHLQVRKINPPLPSEAELRALLELEGGPSRISYIATSSQASGVEILGHTSVLIEWADGRLMMIDAGMDVAAATEFGELMTAVLGSGQVQIEGTISDLLGDAIERVQAVGFTHLHIDHSQGLINFCEARGQGAVAIQTTDQARQHNYNTEEGADIVATSCLQTGALVGDGLIPLEDFPGVAIYPLGGHTPGSTLFAVADGKRLLLFSGDITNSKADILNDQGKGFLYSYLMVPEDTSRTAQLRGWLRALDAQADIEVVVSHDVLNAQDVLEPFTSE